MVIPPDDHWNLENPMENDDNPMNFGVHYFQTTQMSHEICQIECQLDNVSADVTVWCQELCQYICPNMFMSECFRILTGFLRCCTTVEMTQSNMISWDVHCWTIICFARPWHFSQRSRVCHSRASSFPTRPSVPARKAGVVQRSINGLIAKT